MNPQVSIVTAVYNSEFFIESTIESVRHQTFTNWELILIDDCSTDNSVKLIKEMMAEDSRIKLLKNENNSGAAITRNRGIQIASGRYLSFLDSDDIWMPNFLERSLKFLKSNNTSFVFSSYERVDENLTPLYSDFIVPKKVSYNDILKSCSILCSSTVIDIEKLGKFYMPILDKRQDWGLFLKILKKTDFAYGIQEPLVIYRIRKDSISRKKLQLISYQWKVYREIEKLNLIHSLYLLLHWALNGLKKYYINI